MNRLRLEYVTEGFLAAMRRERIQRQPADPSRVPPGDLRDYSPADRSLLMKSIAAAIRRSQGAHDVQFEDWCEQRAVEAADA